MTIETHPLEPFLPENAKILFLGSFPPPKARWSIEFFYPNWINDFWRIQGLLFHDDKEYFSPPAPQGGVLNTTKRFDKAKIIAHCREHGFAFYDTATKVCRQKDNASDNFLDILEPTDVLKLLENIPNCNTIVTTGGKASEELQSYFSGKGIEVEVPKVGDKATINLSISVNHEPLTFNHEPLVWWRMPSTSRAYPMKLEKKAEYYRRVLCTRSLL